MELFGSLVRYGNLQAANFRSFYLQIAKPQFRLGQPDILATAKINSDIRQSTAQ
jgi:hypothetical protein